ncbi:nuclease-related domain-containing protein [Streptacidiphilus sp. MAP12-16]|uniref:nuclease-related domain-containing protein n=1 Tax=Streptacidiphilus sp. MAP12-16 TaxID=3156300 RepID=UPI003518C848
MLAHLIRADLGAGDWRTGLVGERVVGASLRPLAGQGWFILHSIPWPSGADTDHLVIGPPGVFAINTKHHAGARVWVGEKMLRVNNSSTDHLRNSIAEADRVARVLRHWCGWDVPVHPVIAIVGARDIAFATSGARPRSLVVNGTEIDKHLIAQAGHLSASRFKSVYEVARRRSVWQSAPRRAG